MTSHVEEWEWDEFNLGYLGRRGITRRIVLEVANEDPRFRRNKRERSATHLMIGPDRGGTIWTICIVEVARWPGRWRAFNGWNSDDEDKAWYNRHR